MKETPRPCGHIFKEAAVEKPRVEVDMLRVTATYKPTKTTPDRKVISGCGYKEKGMTTLSSVG